MTARRGAAAASFAGFAARCQQIPADINLDADDGCFEDDDDYYYDDHYGEWLPRPEWMHPECVDPNSAVEHGTCCKYPVLPLVRQALDLADAVDGTLTAFDLRNGDGDCPQAAGELARLLESVPGLIAEVREALPDGSRTYGSQTVAAQLLCPVGRLGLLVLELSLRSGCPWACGGHGAPDRRAGIAPLASRLEECQDALFTVLLPRPRQRSGA
jgi:hypothetical protein